MITLDMVVKLPPAMYEGTEYDSFMMATDKLTKMVTLILGREDWSAESWANAFFKSYYRRWGVPARIITDRGKVFLSEFWTALFRILRTSLLVTTAYHPQSDGQSERTNQTVEISNGIRSVQDRDRNSPRPGLSVPGSISVRSLPEPARFGS